jgi:hypothetical protein
MPRVSKEIILHAPPIVLLAIVLAALIGRKGSVDALNDVGMLVAIPNACSLNSRQERAAIDAFDKMLPVLYHNRCLNCHGGVNPYVDPAVGRHLGGAQVDPTGAALPDAACEDCHGLLPGWQVPGVPMHFTGKSPAELCMQFKQFAPGGGPEFVEHIEHEPGLPQFIKTAFLGTRALNTLGEVSYEEATGRPPVGARRPGRPRAHLDQRDRCRMERRPGLRLRHGRCVARYYQGDGNVRGRWLSREAADHVAGDRDARAGADAELCLGEPGARVSRDGRSCLVERPAARWLRRRCRRVVQARLHPSR